MISSSSEIQFIAGAGGVRRHGERRGAHLQRGEVPPGTARPEHPKLHLATRLVGHLQLHSQRHLGPGARAHVAHHPHYRRCVLSGVRGGLIGQPFGDVCHH